MRRRRRTSRRRLHEERPTPSQLSICPLLPVGRKIGVGAVKSTPLCLSLRPKGAGKKTPWSRPGNSKLHRQYIQYVTPHAPNFEHVRPKLVCGSRSRPKTSNMDRLDMGPLARNWWPRRTAPDPSRQSCAGLMPKKLGKRIVRAAADADRKCRESSLEEQQHGRPCPGCDRVWPECDRRERSPETPMFAHALTLGHILPRGAAAKHSPAAGAKTSPCTLTKCDLPTRRRNSELKAFEGSELGPEAASADASFSLQQRVRLHRPPAPRRARARASSNTYTARASGRC